MKSLVRVKAIAALTFIMLGIMQLIPLVPWEVAAPVKFGLLLILIGGLLTLNLSCERCGVSSLNAVLELRKYEYEEIELKRRELGQKGHQLYPYRKRCIHCDLERY